MRGSWAWFHAIWTCGAKVLEYWMMFSLKIKLNHSWKFQRNWNVPLVLLERSWWAGFNGIYLVRSGFRMWEILILKWFLLLKIQINSKKFPFIFGCSKNQYIHCKTMFTCWVSLFCNGFTLGPMTHDTLFLMKSHGRYKEYYKKNNVTYVIRTSVNNRIHWLWKFYFKI